MTFRCMSGDSAAEPDLEVVCVRAEYEDVNGICGHSRQFCANSPAAGCLKRVAASTPFSGSLEQEACQLAADRTKKGRD